MPEQICISYHPIDHPFAEVLHKQLHSWGYEPYLKTIMVDTMSRQKHSKMSGQTITPFNEDISILADPNQETDKNEITVRLIEFILDMNEADQLILLKDLENNHFEEKKIESGKTRVQYEEMRKHPRKTSLIAVDCATHDVCFTNFIQDISRGGVFIETNCHFYVGQKLKMNFSLPEIESPVAVGGEVVRVNSHGIGVKFISGDLNKLDVKI